MARRRRMTTSEERSDERKERRFVWAMLVLVIAIVAIALGSYFANWPDLGR
jgi:cytochrome c-type biogenesis protein CcmH/NrfG